MKTKPHWVKGMVGLCLMPVCIGFTTGLFAILAQTGGADRFWAAFLAGAASWIVAFIVLPKPMWTYVLGHELTHVVWTWLFAGKVTKLKVSSRGGYVKTTRNNFLVALAPYFFPLYAMLVVAVYSIGDHFWDWSAGLPCFHWALGLTYAFHLSFTLYALRARQTDITANGYLFSGTVIWLGNLLVLILAVPLLAGHPALTSALKLCAQTTASQVSEACRWIGTLRP